MRVVNSRPILSNSRFCGRPSGERALALALLFFAATGCSLFSSSPKKPGEGEGPAAQGASSGAKIASLPVPLSSPSERDDPKAPMLRIAQIGSSRDPVGVPYLYGYPRGRDGGSARDRTH
jgi:hypothetical protein